MVDIEGFYTTLTQGKIEETKRLTHEALDAGEPVETVLKSGLIADRTMHAGLSVLKPILSKSAGMMAGKVAIGMVKGDLHDIGKNLAIMMLEGGGFEVVDLGIDVPADKFIIAIHTHQAQVIGLSAPLSTTILEMKNVIQAIGKAGLRDKVKIIVGGAPVTEKFAKEVGADGYAPDAASAVDLVKSLLH